MFLIPRGQPSYHTVTEGETLGRIASYHEIYGDRSQWERIYNANRDSISDPNVITAGTQLSIPR